jgi:hypothetical protein
VIVGFGERIEDHVDPILVFADGGTSRRRTREDAMRRKVRKSPDRLLAADAP